MSMISAYQMSETDKPFQQVRYEAPMLNEGEALIKIAGCGVCHTDLSFWHSGVPTRQVLPLTLGHEISGIVVDGPKNIVDKPVIIPAVLPCGECDLCKRGYSNICQKQRMPGNDFNGGFATHVVVPARFLALVPDAAFRSHTLAELAVIADAVSTPYQVIQKSDLRSGDLAIVVGVGGVGIYTAQIAASTGAHVIALDIIQHRLDALAELGITRSLNITGMPIPDIKKKIKALCKEAGAPDHNWKIYEMSGTKPGQELGFALLGIESTLSVVGFTLDKLEVRLSNLMAFDARVIGTWGCKPELYSAVIDLVAEGKVLIKPFSESAPLSSINTVFQETLEHKRTKRTILIPDEK